MSVADVAVLPHDPYQLRRAANELEEAGPASKRIIAGYGFWLFLLSDIVMFSAFFAAYAVLLGANAGGPTGSQIFDLRNTAVETACLLTSSFTCGMASVAIDANQCSHRGGNLRRRRRTGPGRTCSVPASDRSRLTVWSTTQLTTGM